MNRFGFKRGCGTRALPGIKGLGSTRASRVAVGALADRSLRDSRRSNEFIGTSHQIFWLEPPAEPFSYFGMARQETSSHRALREFQRSDQKAPDVFNRFLNARHWIRPALFVFKRHDSRVFDFDERGNDSFDVDVALADFHRDVFRRALFSEGVLHVDVI